MGAELWDGSEGPEAYESRLKEKPALPGVTFYVRPRWILLVLLLPLVLLGLLALAVPVYGFIRHDPAYFTEAYIEQYSTPGAAARALEQALQTNDEMLLCELQGLRWPAEVETSPSLVFVMLWEYSDRYITYLYFDMNTYERHPHYFEEVKGRWVVSPPDWYYYMRSGQWRSVFMPLAIIWWLLGAVVIGFVWIFRVSEGLRERMYGG